MATPMLCRSEREVPHGADWRHEPKWDGFRALAHARRGHLALLSRRGADLGARFPEVARALSEVVPEGSVVDGELVAVGQGGLSFGALCRRLAGGRADAEALFVAFDLLELRGRDLRGRPLRERRRLLEEALGPKVAADSGALSAIVAGRACALGPIGRVLVTPQTAHRTLAERWRTGLRAAGIEGIVSKRATGPYREGARGWVKVRTREHAELVLCGLVGSGAGIGGLVLGRHDRRGLSYVGRTLPLPAAIGEPMRVLLAELERPESPFTGRKPGGGRFPSEHDYHWRPLAPQVVVEVAVDGWDLGLIRHRASLVRIRPDRRPEDCRED